MLLEVFRTASVLYVSELGDLQTRRAIEQSEIALLLEILVEDLFPVRADLYDHFAVFVILIIVLCAYDSKAHQPHALF